MHEISFYQKVWVIEVMWDSFLPSLNNHNVPNLPGTLNIRRDVQASSILGFTNIVDHRASEYPLRVTLRESRFPRVFGTSQVE